MQRVKAFIVPAAGVAKNDETREKILEYCKKHIIKYSIPKEIEFLDELPKTSVGKTDYHLLEKNESNASE